MYDYYDQAPVATLSEAHSQWHAVHGQVVCPLDCGIGDLGYEEYDEEVHLIRCGHCKDYHPSVADVRDCAQQQARLAARAKAVAYNA